MVTPHTRTRAPRPSWQASPFSTLEKPSHLDASAEPSAATARALEAVRDAALASPLSAAAASGEGQDFAPVAGAPPSLQGMVSFADRFFEAFALAFSSADNCHFALQLLRCWLGQVHAGAEAADEVDADARRRRDDALLTVLALLCMLRALMRQVKRPPSPRPLPRPCR